MGLLETIGLRRPSYGPPDTSHFERAANAAVFDSAQYVMSRSFGLTDSTMPTIRQVRLANQGLFSTCIRLRADALSRAIVGGHGSPGFTVQRVTSQGEYEDVELTHPWVQLLRRPNPNRPALEVWRWASLCRDLRGSADFIVQDDRRGVPIALYEIFPEFGELKPVPNATGGVDGFVFIRADGKRIELEARDVVRLRHPDPITPYENMSLLEKGAFELDKTLYSDIYERDTLKEGRFPPVVLSSDQPVSPQQAQQYGKQFLETYMRTGQHTVKGVPVMGAGLKPVPTAMKADDIALIESRRLTDTHIFWITGVSQGLLSDQANRANAEAAQRFFAEYTIQPAADSFAAQLTFGFSRAFREVTPGSLVIMAPNVVPVDPEQRARIDEIRLRNGTLTVNEVRRRDGQDEVEGGDVALTNSLLVPLAQVASLAEENEPDEEPEDDEDDDTRMFARKHTRSEDARTKAWRAVERKRDPIRRRVEAEALGLFADQLDDVLRRIDQARSLSRKVEEVLTVDKVFDLIQWMTETEMRLSPHIETALRAGFEHGLFTVNASGVDFTSDHPLVRQAIQRIIEKSRDTVVTTHSRLGEVIQQGLRDGASIDEIADRIRDLFEGMAPSRARMIARTTATGGFEAGKLAAFEEAGVTHHRWTSERDDRVRHSHWRVDGEVVRLGQPFSNGLKYPGDPDCTNPAEVVNCRCTTMPADDDDD